MILVGADGTDLKQHPDHFQAIPEFACHRRLVQRADRHLPVVFDVEEVDQ